jgi:hypothetical protein
MARENTERKDDGYDDSARNDPRLVDADFVEKQSLSAKATDFNKDRAAANEARMREEAANEAVFEIARAEMAQAQEQAMVRQAIARKQAVLKKEHARGLAGKARGAAGFARWAGLGIAVSAWFIQFVLGGISLAFIGMWATIDELINGNFLGRAVNWVTGLFNVDLANVLPVDSFAIGFWALASIVALCTFFGFLIWFWLTDTHVFGGPLTALVTALTFALSIMPVSNLFPWIPLWIIFMNVSSMKALITRSSVMGGV